MREFDCAIVPDRGFIGFFRVLERLQTMNTRTAVPGLTFNNRRSGSTMQASNTAMRWQS
jgi:hypothetical protein